MRRIILISCFVLALFSCKETSKPKNITAQQLVDKAITASGGEKFNTHKVSFVFRDKTYQSYKTAGKKVLKRIAKTDSVTITDIKTGAAFERYFNDNLLDIPDTLATKYANGVNSVHYFARLPFGLNDKAVHKELLGEVSLKGQDYYKLKVTFDQQNGGDDFEDVYLYWLSKEDFKPHYLAYEFHTNGGGMRFREAYNERYVNGIRFVDYKNLKNKKDAMFDFYKIDSVFAAGQLELLSKIELQHIQVSPEN